MPDSTLVNTMRGLEGAGCTDGCILVYYNVHGHPLECESKIVDLNQIATGSTQSLM